MTHSSNVESTRAAAPKTTMPARRMAAAGLLAVVAASAAYLSGCNTTEGAGRDVQAVGRGIERAADSAKP